MGISHRAVLHHFGTKEQLLAEAVQEVRRREQDRLRGTAVAADAPVDELLRVVWRRVSDPGHLPYVRVHFELRFAAGRDTALYGRFLDGLIASWVELIAGRLEAEGLSQDGARALATIIYAAVRGLQLDLLAISDRGRVDRAFEELVGAVRVRVPRGSDATG